MALDTGCCYAEFRKYTLNAECRYAERHYAGCHYAECHYAEFVKIIY
jgi:hypothetical protein